MFIFLSATAAGDHFNTSSILPQQERRPSQTVVHRQSVRLKRNLCGFTFESLRMTAAYGSPRSSALICPRLYLTPLDKGVVRTETGDDVCVCVCVCVCPPVNQASISGYLAGWFGVRCCRRGWEMTAPCFLLNTCIHIFHLSVYCLNVRARVCLSVAVARHFRNTSVHVDS